MKKLLVVFVFVLSSWVVRGEEKVNVTMEPMPISVQPARYQLIKEISFPDRNFVAGALVDTEQGRVWILASKGKSSFTLTPVERTEIPLSQNTK